MRRIATAAELAELSGLLARESARLAKAGDRRDKIAIVDAILDECERAETVPELITRVRLLASI